MTKISKDPNFGSMSNKEIMDSFLKSAVIEDIKSIDAKELQIMKDSSGKPLVIAEYQVLVPLMGNVTALLDFKASTDPAQSASVAE